MSIMPSLKEMRRAARQEVCYRCDMAGADFGPVPGLLVNISPYGCMLRCSLKLPTETLVGFILPVVGRCEARVAWAIGGRIGLEFTQAIELDPYLAMLEQLNRPGDEMGIY